MMFTGHKPNYYKVVVPIAEGASLPDGLPKPDFRGKLWAQWVFPCRNAQTKIHAVEQVEALAVGLRLLGVGEVDISVWDSPGPCIKDAVL